jgi:hypothetical protein
MKRGYVVRGRQHVRGRVNRIAAAQRAGITARFEQQD